MIKILKSVYSSRLKECPETGPVPTFITDTPCQVRYDVQDKIANNKVPLHEPRDNRESGESPERSRHCNGELVFNMSLGICRGRRRTGVSIPSQETYLVGAHQDSTRIGVVYEHSKRSGKSVLSAKRCSNHSEARRNSDVTAPWAVPAGRFNAGIFLRMKSTYTSHPYRVGFLQFPGCRMIKLEEM